MKAVLLTIMVACVALATRGQELAQTVSGKISDAITSLPLPGASVSFTRGDESIALTRTDEAGKFAVKLAVGRYRLTVTYTGYKTRTTELAVIGGKETVVDLALSTSAQELETIEIASTPLSAELPGLHSLSIEKTLRVPANFFDPVRVATAYPGVIATNDQNNSIIVRGNSPNGLLWRLNGLDVINPNHQANAGTLSDKPAANGGGVNILSSQMLENTDFYTGAFPVAYGNALSGVIDMRLRNGSKNNFEYTAKASLIGLDFAAEGPLGHGRRTSFLTNYRYSTVGLLSAVGIDFGGESINFQDLAFHLNSEFDDGGGLSMFAVWGNGTNDFNGKDSADWKEDKDRYDINYSSANFAGGATYTRHVGPGKAFAGVVYSYASQDRTALISDEVAPMEVQLLDDQFAQSNHLLSARVNYLVPVGRSGAWQAGVMANMNDHGVSSRTVIGGLTGPTALRFYGGDVQGFLLQPYMSLEGQVTSGIRLSAGARYMHFTFNNSGVFEPRVSFDVRTSDRSSLEVAYGLTSQLQLPQVYGAEGNRGLGFTKSHHGDLSYSFALPSGLRLATSVFYQYLFDVPIESAETNPQSSFSTLNLNEEPAPPNLVNKGTGENYGIDVTIEKSFFVKDYFLVAGSYYESKYVGADRILRDTRYNGKFTLSSVYGTEWRNESRNRVIGLNTRVLYLGGLLLRSVDAASSATEGETIYQDVFSRRMQDYFRIDLRISFRKDKPGYTRTFAVDIQNLTNNLNDAYQYYDLTQGQIVMRHQLGIIPVLVYRIDF